VRVDVRVVGGKVGRHPVDRAVGREVGRGAGAEHGEACPGEGVLEADVNPTAGVGRRADELELVGPAAGMKRRAVAREECARFLLGSPAPDRDWPLGGEEADRMTAGLAVDRPGDGGVSFELRGEVVFGGVVGTLGGAAGDRAERREDGSGGDTAKSTHEPPFGRRASELRRFRRDTASGQVATARREQRWRALSRGRASPPP
jgi:hypothetical protein